MNISNEPTELKVSFDTEKVYPALEDLEVTPSMEKQHFKSDKYGYNEIIVGAIEGETLEVTPKKTEQSYSGVFTKVDVNAIESEELNITPSEEQQLKEGLFDKVSVGAIQTEEKVATLDFGNTDTVEVTPIEGSYLKKVTINKDENLVPKNILKDKEIDGIVGSYEPLDTSDATATANDIINPKTAYVNGEKIVGNIIPNYSSVSLWSAKMYEFEEQFNDIDPLKGIATSFDNNNIMIHNIDSDYSIIKTFTVPVTWKTTTTKEILSAKIFKGNFDSGYVIYVLTLDTASPCYLITRLVISKELDEVSSISTYTETYTTNITDGMSLDIERRNVAVPSPTEPYVTAYICFQKLGTWNYHWNYGYVTKVDFSTNTPTTKRAERIQHNNGGSGNVDNSEGIINLQFDETGKYLSCLFTMESRKMNISSVYYVETMATVISTIDVAVTSVRSKPLFNIEDEVYTISDGKLLLLDGVNYSEVGSISDTSMLGYRSYYKTFKDNIFLMSYDTKTIMRYALSSGKTSFSLKETIYNGEEFNVYKTGVTAQNNTYIYNYSAFNSGEISSMEMLGKNYYLTDSANVVASDILKGKVAYGSNGKIKGTLSDENLLPENIKEGITILGVTGTYTGS